MKAFVLKYRFQLIFIIVLAIGERLWVSHIHSLIYEQDYFIEEMIKKYRIKLLSLNKGGSIRYYETREMKQYSFALCFGFGSSKSPDKEKMGRNDLVSFKYVNPRSLTSFSRLFWSNKIYQNHGVPFSEDVGLIYGNGTWKRIDYIPS